jgi:hypothetical protein
LIHFLEKKTAILITALFLFAYLIPSHGIVPNGLWIEPGLFYAPLSALATLFGIVSFMERRYLRSGMMFGLSIILQSLYGLTVLGFLFLGFIMILYRKGLRKTWSTLIMGMLPSLCVILYIAYFRTYFTSDVEFSHRFVEWFRFISATDSDDVLLLYTLRNYGYGLVPLCLTGLYLAYREKDKHELQFLTIGSVIMLGFYTIIELIHATEVFFGSFSEIFVSLQMRRGIWIAALFSLIQISKNIYERREEIFENRTWLLLLIFSIATYLIPSVLGVIVLISALSVIQKNRQSVFLVFVTVSMVAVAIHYRAEEFDVSGQVQLFMNSLLLTTVVAVTMLISRYRNRERDISFAPTILVVMIVLFSGKGLLDKKLVDSASVLMSDGLLAKTNVEEMVRAIPIFPYDKTADDCMREVSSPTSGDKIQLPITGARNTWTPLFSYETVFGYHELYSREDYEVALRDLRSIFGENTVDTFFQRNTYFKQTGRGREIMHEYFLAAYKNLPRSRLENLRDNAGLRFYLLDTDRSDLRNAFMCQGDKYYVYDLNVL